MPKPIPSEDRLAAALAAEFPEVGEIIAAAGDAPLFVVGGAVRDLLLGLDRGDLDLVVEGDPAELAARLGGEVVEHPRFATAIVSRGEHRIDIARARRETYARPGALPDVNPAGIEQDLARRDFTVNAMAIRLGEEDPAELLDPHGGRADLESGLLRVLHAESFRDDPTRALRAARYAARFGFDLEAATAALVSAADLETVSADRRRAELLRMAAEPHAAAAFALLESWNLIRLRPGGPELAGKVLELVRRPPWSGIEDPAAAVLAAATGPEAGEMSLATFDPSTPSAAVEAARGHSEAELILARAMGASWLDCYLESWSGVELEIDGDDLIGAGVPAGPAVGRGLRRALARKLDGEVKGREEELEAAVRGAGE